MGNLQVPRISEGNELNFKFKKSIDLRTLENMIENEDPFHTMATAVISSDLDGSILAMNSKFAKEYGFSSSSEAMIDIQHVARPSIPLMGGEISKKHKFYPDSVCVFVSFSLFLFEFLAQKKQFKSKSNLLRKEKLQKSMLCSK